MMTGRKDGHSIPAEEHVQRHPPVSAGGSLRPGHARQSCTSLRVLSFTSVGRPILTHRWKEFTMRNGTPVRTPIGNGTINGESTRTGTLLYRVSGVNGSLGAEAWFEPQFVSR